MHTISQSDKNRYPIKMEESIGLGHEFSCDPDTVLREGTLVKLDGTDIVPANGANDIPLGIVSVPNKRDKSKVTVDTIGVGRVLGVAKTNLTAGTPVKAEGLSTALSAEGHTKYSTAAATQLAVGIVLKDAVANGEVEVLIFYAPVYIK